MKYNVTNIITGIMALFLISYVLISFFTFVYLGFTKRAHEKKSLKIFLATALVSLSWVVSTLVSIVIASSYGVMIFAIVSLIFIFGSSYFFAHKVLDFTDQEKIIYSLIAAVIFNPAWLTVTGIL